MNENDILQIITDAIKGVTHEYYDHTVHMAMFGKQVVTGKGQEEYILRLKPQWQGSDDDISDYHKKERKQMAKLYQPRTKAAYNKIAGYFERVFRVDKQANEIKLSENANETIKQELETEINNFGGTTLLNYLEQQYLYRNGCDPNAWLLLDRTVLNGVERINPIVVPSWDAQDFKYILGELQYLTVKSKRKVKDQILKEWFIYVKGAKYIVLEDSEHLTLADKEGSERIEVDDQSYLIFREPFTPVDKIPAIRFGYNFDVDSGGKTYATFWDAAEYHMRDLIDRKAQLDMSYMLHTFLQKVQYYQKCTYHSGTHECNGGLVGDVTCPACKGTGQKIHQDAADILLVELPEEDKPVLKPSEIAAYISMPFEIVKQQQGQVDDLPKKMCEAVFGVDLDKDSTGITTATEVSSSYNTAYDKMNKFANGYVHLYMFLVDCIAKVKGLNTDQFETMLTFPNEFDMETLGELLATLKMAKESGASYDIIKTIERKIAIKQNKGNQRAVRLADALLAFKPFKHLSQDQLETKLSMLDETNRFRVIWEFYDMITQDIQNNFPQFALLEAGRKEIIFNTVVDKYIDLVKAQQAATRDEMRDETEEILNQEEDENEIDG